MSNQKKKLLGSDIVKESKPAKLHDKATEYLIFQLYIASEYIYDNLGLESLKNFYKSNQESFFNLKMSGFYKLMEGIIKKLPKGLKMKEGLKMMIDQLQFLESPKNIVIIERTNEKATFEFAHCTIRKEFNKLAKKSKKIDLVDKCCLWCIESIPIAEKYGFDYSIEITPKGCLNFLT